MRVVVALVAVVVLTAGCGSAHRSTCPVIRGRWVTQPWDHVRIIAFGKPPVEMNIDNQVDPRHGTAGLGTRNGGWFGLKTHFWSIPGYTGPVHVHVRRIDASGAARLGGSQGPTDGSSFSAPAEVDSPVPTWVRSPGCYEWDISGHGFSERIVVRALLHG